MDASSPPSDAERELDELRRRAYGPHPDIQADPAALARLTELEAARTASPPQRRRHRDQRTRCSRGWRASCRLHPDRPGADRPDSATSIAPVAASSADSPRSLWHRLTATRARRSSFVAGALVAVLALAYTVAWLVRPHPDATLHPIADEPDGVVLSMLRFPRSGCRPLQHPRLPTVSGSRTLVLRGHAGLSLLHAHRPFRSLGRRRQLRAAWGRSFCRHRRVARSGRRRHGRPPGREHHPVPLPRRLGGRLPLSRVRGRLRLGPRPHDPRTPHQEPGTFRILLTLRR